jgi:hypothetical protein
MPFDTDMNGVHTHDQDTMHGMTRMMIASPDVRLMLLFITVQVLEGID